MISSLPICAALDAGFGRELLDESLDFGIGNGRTTPFDSDTSRRRSSGRSGPSRTGDRRPAVSRSPGCSRCLYSLRIRQPTSSPARSPTASGPIAMPNSKSAASTCSTAAPSSTRNCASRCKVQTSDCRRSRGSCRPARRPCSVSCASAIEVAITLRLALACRVRSPSSRITLAGLKK